MIMKRLFRLKKIREKKDNMKDDWMMVVDFVIYQRQIMVKETHGNPKTFYHWWNQ